MKVTLETYSKQILGVVLNSKFADGLRRSYKDELFTLKPNEPKEIRDNTLNALFELLSELSDDNILWQVDEEEKDMVYKLQSDGNKWRRDLENHLGLALNLNKLPKLWEKE